MFYYFKNINIYKIILLFSLIMYSGSTIFLANLTAFFSVEKVLSATFIGEGKVFPL